MQKNKIISIAAGVIIFVVVAICLITLKPNNGTPEKKEVAATKATIVTYSGSAETVYTVNDPDADEALLNEIALLMEERLMYHCVIDYETKINAEKKQISIDFSWESVGKKLDAKHIADEVCKINEISIRKGDGSSAESGEEILSAADIASAEDFIEKNKNGNETYKVMLKLNEEGKEKLKKETEAIAGSDTAIHFYLDNNLLGSQTYTEADSSGIYVISGGFKTQEEAVELKNKIELDSLPAEVTLESFSEQK